MGEEQGNVFEPQFNRSVKVQSTDHRITSAAGVIVLREAEHRLGLFKAIKKTSTIHAIPNEFATRSTNSFESVSLPWPWAARHKTMLIDLPTTLPFEQPFGTETAMPSSTNDWQVNPHSHA